MSPKGQKQSPAENHLKEETVLGQQEPEGEIRALLLPGNALKSQKLGQAGPWRLLERTSWVPQRPPHIQGDG